MSTLLRKLIEDEKKNDLNLYSSGPYWKYKNLKTIKEIKKKGLGNFRDHTTGIGTSFADNLILDTRNELNYLGLLISKFFSLPFIKNIFNQQINITRNHIDNYLINLSIVYRNNSDVLKLIEKYKFENTTDFGCIQKFELKNKEYSTHYLNMANRVDILSTKFDFNKIKSFFEIGGGFGANLHFLLSNYKNIKKIVYLDTVPNIFVACHYLKNYYGENVKDYLDLKDLKEIKFSNNDELEILCIPPWLIEKLNLNIDHFHNAASFVEMPKNIIENYCKYIKKFNTKEISLISYKNYNSETTFNPEELNNFFDNKLIISWHDSLIREYNKKQIYLSSIN